MVILAYIFAPKIFKTFETQTDYNEKAKIFVASLVSPVCSKTTNDMLAKTKYRLPLYFLRRPYIGWGQN